MSMYPVMLSCAAKLSGILNIFISYPHTDFLKI